MAYHLGRLPDQPSHDGWKNLTLRIRDWNDIFENAESRKLKSLRWVAMPNKTNSQGYTALVEHPRGALHYGAWCAIVLVCSLREPREKRGTLPEADGTIGGISRALGRISRLPPEIFEEVLPRLINDQEIAWIEQLGDVSGKSPDVSGKSPGRIEGNGRESSSQGRERQKQPPFAKNGVGTHFFSQKIDDDKPKNIDPDAELRRIYVEKTGVDIPKNLERRIWEAVELRACRKAAFIEALQEHIPNAWHNPAGFLTHFARSMGQVAAVAIEIPVAPPEPPKNAKGRCSLCNGVGKVGEDWCSCSIGRDFHVIEIRALGKKQIESAASENAPAKEATA